MQGRAVLPADTCGAALSVYIPTFRGKSSQRCAIGWAYTCAVPNNPKPPRQFKVGDKIRVNLHHGKIEDAIVKAVIEDKDGLKLQVDFGVPLSHGLGHSLGHKGNGLGATSMERKPTGGFSLPGGEKPPARVDPLPLMMAYVKSETLSNDDLNTLLFALYFENQEIENGLVARAVEVLGLR